MSTDRFLHLSLRLHTEEIRQSYFLLGMYTFLYVIHLIANFELAVIGETHQSWFQGITLQ